MTPNSIAGGQRRQFGFKIGTRAGLWSDPVVSICPSVVTLGTSPVLTGGKAGYIVRAGAFVELSVAEEVAEEVIAVSLI